MLPSDAAELPLFTAGVPSERIRDTFRQLPDGRKGGNNRTYTLEDAALSAFAVFFTQSPSFLDYRVRMQKERGRHNADSLFGVHRIPSDPQIRNLLDPVAPHHLAPLFIDTVEALDRLGELEGYRHLAGSFLIPLDGTEYFASEAISCPSCSTRTLANGKTQHYHLALPPVLVAPGREAVFPLPPEFVRAQDGHAKQDGELAASARWLEQWGPRIAPWNVTLLGDDLDCHQPFCQQVRAQGCHFPFVCLPSSHATLYEWVADFERTGEVPTRVKTRWTGKQRLTDTYRYLNDLPLRDSDDALLVGWCELATTDATGKVLYRNAWATSHPVGPDNVVALVEAGRSRWKIENENNNILKTNGYRFEHNDGHGKQHLCAVLATPIILPGAHRPRLSRPALSGRARPAALAAYLLRTPPCPRSVSSLYHLGGAVRLHARCPAARPAQDQDQGEAQSWVAANPVSPPASANLPSAGGRGACAPRAESSLPAPACRDACPSPVNPSPAGSGARRASLGTSRRARRAQALSDRRGGD